MRVAALPALLLSMTAEGHPALPRADRSPAWEERATCWAGCYAKGPHKRDRLPSAEGKPERLPALAAELVRLKVDNLISWEAIRWAIARGAPSVCMTSALPRELTSPPTAQ
jgi:hypothetical protein